MLAILVNSDYIEEGSELSENLLSLAVLKKVVAIDAPIDSAGDLAKSFTKTKQLDLVINDDYIKKPKPSEKLESWCIIDPEEKEEVDRRFIKIL